MSELWPADVKSKLDRGPSEPLRPFKCLLLMPFESRFNRVADLLKSTVEEVLQAFKNFGFEELPRIQRLDWITSSGVIQQEIWREVREADLVFCDVTGYNPNVMFEAGVCAAWKRMEQVVFLRDHFYKGQSPFDIAPIRYTEYELTSDGFAAFRNQIYQLVTNAVVGFPDNQGTCLKANPPLHIDFSHGQDDLRIYTPPFAHRRVLDSELEFGSLASFSNSWASIGKEPLLNLTARFTARFSNPVPGQSYIGIGVRSQHYFANFAHIFYVNCDGSIVLTEPNETPPTFYSDRRLRDASTFELAANHNFTVIFNERFLRVGMDDFSMEFPVAQMPKVLGPGLVRLQCYRTWMAVSEVDLSA